MKIGRNATMPPVYSKPSRPLPQPCWKISVIAPNVAATDRRLSTIAFAAITIDRNVSSRIMNASSSTKAKTSGTARFIWSLKSFEFAVWPETP